jgi:hypothetical protein
VGVDLGQQVVGLLFGRVDGVSTGDAASRRLACSLCDELVAEDSCFPLSIQTEAGFYRARSPESAQSWAAAFASSWESCSVPSP